MSAARAEAPFPGIIILLAMVLAGCGLPGSERQAVAPDGSADRGPVAAYSNDTAGWEPLFDGRTLEGWRGFQRQDVPERWTVSENAIHFTPSGGDIDTGLITEAQYADFDLRLEWKVGPRGNSGVFFRVTEEHDAIWKSGPEYQIVDNLEHPDGQRPISAAGSNYGLHGPEHDYARPAGEWNAARIVARGPHVEHWLNGRRVVEYELWSDDWERRVARSPFSEWPAYGRSRSGHIALQEGGPVWYRNIRLRRLNGSGPPARRSVRPPVRQAAGASRQTDRTHRLTRHGPCSLMGCGARTGIECARYGCLRNTTRQHWAVRDGEALHLFLASRPAARSPLQRLSGAETFLAAAPRSLFKLSRG